MDSSRSSRAGSRDEVPRTVALLGIDGAGKTTAAKAIVRALRQKGVQARYFENAGGRPVLNLLAGRLGHPDAIAWLGVDRFEAIEMRFRRFAMRRALRWVAREPGRLAVCDRWTWCQYATMAARSSDPSSARALYDRIPDPDLVFYLAIDPERARQRVELRGTDHESLSYLTSYAAAYEELPEFASFTRIDANDALDGVVATVMARISDEAAGSADA